MHSLFCAHTFLGVLGGFPIVLGAIDDTRDLLPVLLAIRHLDLFIDRRGARVLNGWRERELRPGIEGQGPALEIKGRDRAQGHRLRLVHHLGEGRHGAHSVP